MAEATMAASAAILKTRYPKGRPNKVNYEKFKFTSTVKKEEDFKGENFKLALITENPQGSAPSVATALANAEQSTFRSMLVTPVSHFGIGLIASDALKRAKDPGALLDLWQTEMDGVAETELKGLEINSFRSGNGIIGRTNSAVASTSITLEQPADAVNFDLFMTIRLVDVTTLSPTVRAEASRAVVTGINRATGVLTFASNLSVHATGATLGDYFVRAGDQAIGGVASVITGLDSWVEGGSSPGALFGLTRSTDPVRLAGQVYAATGVPMEDAIIEAESMLIVQGQLTSELVAWVNPLDIKELKKSLGGKVTYQKTEMKSTVAKLSFKAIEFEGDNGTIKLVSNPFVPKGTVYLLDQSRVLLRSEDSAPHLVNYEGLPFIRDYASDKWQARFASYVQMIVDAPSRCLRITGWGA